MSTPLPSTADRPARVGWIVFAWVCRFALGGLFLFAAVTKIVDLAGFEDQLLTQSPLPKSVAIAVARILPWLELTLAFCLLLGRADREAALLAALLLAAFLVYTAFFATTADCGCLLFPITESALPRSWLLARDGLALAAAIVTAFGAHRARALFTTETQRTQRSAARHEVPKTKDGIRKWLGR